MNNHNLKRIKKTNRPVGRFRPKGQALVGWWPTGVARPKGWDGPWLATVRRGVRPARDHRGHGPHGGATDDGWLVLVVGLGQRRKLEGASGWAPSKVSSGGAHPSGVSTARGRSSGERLHTLMPDVEVVAGGDPGEVLRLGRGYAVVRAEPK
jgi:hypothetical protein